MFLKHLFTSATEYAHVNSMYNLQVTGRLQLRTPIYVETQVNTFKFNTRPFACNTFYENVYFKIYYNAFNNTKYHVVYTSYYANYNTILPTYKMINNETLTQFKNNNQLHSNILWNCAFKKLFIKQQVVEYEYRLLSDSVITRRVTRHYLCQ